MFYGIKSYELNKFHGTKENLINQLSLNINDDHNLMQWDTNKTCMQSWSFENHAVISSNALCHFYPELDSSGPEILVRIFLPAPELPTSAFI